MDTLNMTEPHYIRCVKPNTVLKPGIFENFNVLNQLRCGVTNFLLYPIFSQEVLEVAPIDNAPSNGFLAGCFRSNKDQLCWVSHEKIIRRVP